MKRLYLLLAFSLVTLGAFSQADTLPPYKQVPFVPPFKIQLANGNWFSKADMQNKPTLILYFSPDCGHCQLETEELVTKAKPLNNFQIVMITSRSFDEMKNFSDKYMLQKIPNIKIGSDTARFVTHFYKVKFTPFSAVYDKKGSLVKSYESGIDFDELINLAK